MASPGKSAEVGRVHAAWSAASDRTGDPGPASDLVTAVLAGADTPATAARLQAAVAAWALALARPSDAVVGLAQLRAVCVRLRLTPRTGLVDALDRATHWAVEALTERDQRLAQRDALTGLALRGPFDDDLARFAERARDHAEPFALVVADVDGLKAVNDGKGHPAGDAVLAAVAAALGTALRDSDRAYRIGGDEFALLLPGTAATDCTTIMERIRRSGAPPFSWGHATAPVEGVDADVLMKLADERLYASRARRWSRLVRWRRPPRAVLATAAAVALVLCGAIAVRAGGGAGCLSVDRPPAPAAATLPWPQLVVAVPDPPSVVAPAVDLAAPPATSAVPAVQPVPVAAPTLRRTGRGRGLAKRVQLNVGERALAHLRGLVDDHQRATGRRAPARPAYPGPAGR